MGLYGSGTKSTLYGGGNAKPSGGGGGIFSRIASHIPGHSVVGEAAHFPVALTGHLLTDVKDAVVGLPMGLVTAAEHPVQAVKAAAGGTWFTWSPLFHGHPLETGKRIYDHPLAPVLDVLSVVSLGIGSAARGAAAISEVGDTTSTLSKIAKLAEPKTVMLHDYKGERLPVAKTLSRKPTRRLMQEMTIRYGDKLPQWYHRSQFDVLHRVNLAHRAVAKDAITASAIQRAKSIEASVQAGDHKALQLHAQNWIDHTNPEDHLYGATRAQMDSIIQGAQALQDITELGQRARSTIAAHMHANLLRHNDTFTLAEAQKLLKGRHNMLVLAPEYADKRYWTQLHTLTRQHEKAALAWEGRRASWAKQVAHWDKIRRDSAALVHSHDKIRAELQAANDEMSALLEAGHNVAGGARDRLGRPVANPTRPQLMNYETNAVQDQVDRIARLEKQNEEAYKAKGRYDNAHARLQKLLQERDAAAANIADKKATLDGMMNRASQDYYASHGETFDSLVKFVDNFGTKISAGKDFNRAAHIVGPDGEKRYFVVPKHDAYNLGYEGGNSLRFLHKVLHKPTMIWKTAVIGYSPRTITNNAIGNWLIYASRELPSAHGAMAVGDAIRFAFKPKVDGEVLFPGNHFLYRYFAHEMSDQFGVGNEITKLLSDPTMKDRLRGGFYPAVAKIEKNQRAMTIYSALRSMPEVRAEIRRVRAEGTLRGSQAVDTAIERVLRNNPAVREEAALASRRLMGDYVTLSETEKFLRDIVPFYLWNRHILKTTGNMLLDQPGRLAIMQQLSNLGEAQTEAQLGQVPDFLKGAIPLAALGLGDKTGRANVMLTASLNPFATVGDLAASVNAWTAGQSAQRGDAVSQVNPFLTSAFESIFQTSLLTGAPSPRKGGIAEDVIGRTISTLPQAKIADALTTANTLKTPKGNDYLFGRDKRSQLSSFLGVPLRNVSIAQAQKLAAEAVKKSQHKKTGGGLYG